MVGVDVGGTFTDVVTLDEDGRIITAKVPTDVQSNDTSVLAGAERVDVHRARTFNLASTAGLNALITRRLPKIAFLTTLGHRDILDRGTLTRPVEALTDPSWHRAFGDASRPLVPRYLRRGVLERITGTGEILIPLAEEQAREQLRILRRCQISGLAICLLNAYINPIHEVRLRELVREELGSISCSLSTEVSPTAKEFWRASTTVVDVLMKLIYGAYNERMETGLAALGFKGTFNYADCRATLTPASYVMREPYRIVAGGPAAGTVACAHFGRMIRDANLICADVGGTSCDISVVSGGQPSINPTFTLEWDLVVSAPSIDVISLGAGGGSVVAISPTGDVKVGPESAGADPGPACYQLGGTRPTVTDAAVLMGILTADGLLGGTMPLSSERSWEAFEELETPLPVEKRIRYAWSTGLSNVAEGLIDIAIQRGIDPRDFSLVAYGAAGPMLLPFLLDLVPLRRLIVPPHPGVFSALGLLSTDQMYAEQRSAYILLSAEGAGAIDEIYRTMEEGLLGKTSLDRRSIMALRSFDGRLRGQGWDTPFVRAPSGEITPEAISQMVRNFHTAYELRWGDRFEQFPVEGVTYRVEVVVPTEKVEYRKIGTRTATAPAPRRTTTIRYLYEEDVEAHEFQRHLLLSGDEIDGPAVVREETSTTFVPRGRQLTVGSHGELIIE